MHGSEEEEKMRKSDEWMDKTKQKLHSLYAPTIHSSLTW